MSEISAYHEAGHAFMACYVGARVRTVTICPDWDDGPDRFADIQVEWPTEKFDARSLSENMINVALAGPAAEMIYTGEPWHPGFVGEWAADWEAAWEAAALLFPDEKKRLAQLEQMSTKLHRLFAKDELWAAIAAIADGLLAHETLEGGDVAEIMRYWVS